MAFRTPARYNNPIKPVSDNSLSTHSLQPKAIPDPNSKWIGMGSEMPWRMTRSGIEKANGAQETSAQRRIIARNLWKMRVDVIPWFDQRGAFTVRVALCFFLIGVFQLRILGLPAYIKCGGRIGNGLFPFTVRGALTFHRRHSMRA